jgi:hypothetical protein
MRSIIREMLFNTLLEGVSEQTKNDAHGFRLFSESTNEDLDKIEPMILKMLADRDQELRAKMLCGHPIVLMELLPFAEQPEGAVMATDNEHLKILDPKKLAYRCSACEREKLFVRALVEHVKKLFVPCGEQCSRPSPATVERELLEAMRAQA